MKIIDKPLKDLKVYKNSLRNNGNAIEYVVKSISKFGIKQPIVIDNDGTIVAGNTVYIAAKQLNMESVPCVMADDLTPEEIKRYRIADNKTAEMSRWNYLGLAKEIKTISGDELLDIGFNQREVDLLKGLDMEMEAPSKANDEGSSAIIAGGIYKPNYNPRIGGGKVTVQDIEQAKLKEETRFLPEVKKVRVYKCPKCGRRFEVR